MIDGRTLSVAGFVSQATFALTFALLAWIDRRTKGMAWFACAAVLQLLITTSRGVHTPSAAVQGSGGAAVFIAVFFFLYMGLRWFAVRRGLRSRSGPGALAVAVVGILGMAFVSPNLALLAGKLVSLIIIGCTVRMLWSSRLAALRVPLRTSAVLLSVLGVVLTVRLALPLAPPSPAVTALGDAMRAATLLCITPLLLSFLGLFVAETNRRLHDETRVDVLTGLRNRRAFEEMAGREARLCATGDVPLALLMMDLDHFKQLNDTWGHGLGDRALRAMGSVLLTVIGEEAVSARMGGEEFAVLLPGYEVTAAAAVAERVRATVEDLRLAESEQLARFTVSVGVSVLLTGERSWTEMMGRADDALYRAKREGRNRVLLDATGEAVGARNVPPAKRSWRKHLLLPRQGPML